MALFEITSVSGFDLEQMNLLFYWDGGVVNSTLAFQRNYYSADHWENLTLRGVGITPHVTEAMSGRSASAGTITSLWYDSSGASWRLSGLSAQARDFFFTSWEDPAAVAALRLSLFSGDDVIWGGPGSDRLYGYAGDDLIHAGEMMSADLGADTVFGGAGNDTILDASGVNVLRGELGNDQIVGGSEFDDMHGNQGDDTLAGGGSDDWVVGGMDDDLLHGDEGSDVVYGNLGADTCQGGDGADVIRGGQGDDLVLGAAGDDRIWGDRGNDTILGGAGADTFNAHAEVGVDRVLDFDPTEGDRIKVEFGTYTVSTVGSDTVIDFGGGNQIVLVGMTTFQAAWIV